ncbi:DUF4062 domain-containing protein [Longimicrobium sp.]|jgi:hypothetical protein|uniref:DUF4062 domain-containing protein n=1 Tax=Longimicrobium sp. TaxID=2029185 RepID=UPI002F95D894
MDKRYQVFISSTFADLHDERRRVMQTIMELDCFPAGMELFPAADEEQWEFIKRVIDDCDYYLLIIGGRYGSLTPEGISYTEKEYDYAVERGLRVLAFLHERPEEIAASKSELDPDARKKLDIFRDRVAQGRLVRFWTRGDELPGLVALSLSKTMKAYPAVGWVRATGAPSAETLSELNDLRRGISNLEKELEDARRQIVAAPVISDLAPLQSRTTIQCEHRVGSVRRSWSVTLAWQELFTIIAPALLDHPSDSSARTRISALLHTYAKKDGMLPVIKDIDYDTMKVQLMAYQLVQIKYTKSTSGGMGLFWSLTPKGQRAMMEWRSVKGAGVEADYST